jgi:hypothetical protein
VRKWCSVAHNREYEAFVFAPPIPGAKSFQTGGGYAAAHARGLDALADEKVRENVHNHIAAGILSAGIGSAAVAGFIAETLIGASRSTSLAIMRLIGSNVFRFAGRLTRLAASLLSALVTAVIIIFVVVTIVASIQLAEYESVGETLKSNMEEALETDDPLGLYALSQELAGLPFNSQFDPADPPLYRTEEAISMLAARVTLWTSVDENGVAHSDLGGLWKDNATTPDDPKLLVRPVGTQTWEPVDQLEVGELEGDGAKVRFSDGWMVVKRPGEAAEPELSFTFLDQSGHEHDAVRSPGSDGGWLVSNPEGEYPDEGYAAKVITMQDPAGQNLQVRLRPKTLDYLAGPRPTAIGPLVAGRPVILRPNPVNNDGTTVDFVEAEQDFAYDWTVSRLDPTDGTWSDVPVDDALKTSFVPTKTGQYQARVTMTSVIDGSVVKYGVVPFSVTAPTPAPSVLVLQDDGTSQVEIDLQVMEEIPGDDLDIDVAWPPVLGSDTPPTTHLDAPCFQTGPLECTTQRTGPSNLLVHTLSPKSDLREPVVVTVTNSYGGSQVFELPLDSPIRPSVAPPDPDANAGLPGEVVVTEDSTQLNLPLTDGYSTYQVGTLVPGTGAGTDFGLVDIETGNTSSADVPIPGTAELFAQVDQADDGTWNLQVFGRARPDEVGDYEVPLLVQQTNTGRQLVMVTVHVVPSTADRFRAGVQTNVDPLDFAVDSVPDLYPAIWGGRTGFAAYDGGMCISLKWSSPDPAAVRCGPVSDFFRDTGEARPFPVAEMFPGGMGVGSVQATAWLTDVADDVDNTPLTSSFFLTQPATWDPPAIRLDRPVVKGRAVVGARLRAAAAVDPADATLTYRWLRDGRRIAAATGRSYVPKRADLGHRLAVRVTAKKTDWAGDTATSRATATVSRR